MLLPQSSAFAALKNRLNSVSAIGYLHIAPRAYVIFPHIPLRNNSVTEAISTLQFQTHQKSMEAHTLGHSTSTPAGPSNYDRPNRLKGRDEGGIKWTELLEKFKSVQDKARRAQGGGNGDDGLELGDPRGAGANAKVLKDQKMGPPAPPSRDASAPPSGAVAGMHKPRSSLGKFGRLGGGIAAKPKR